MENNMRLLRMVLNHMGNTAVYVIRQDDHRMLFFYVRVKEVEASVEVGL